MTTRSAIYLQGNKTLLYPSIKPFLEEEGRDTLIEPFFGSGVISLNANKEELFDNYFCNDIADWLVELHKCMQDPLFMTKVVIENEAYTDDKEGYLKLREDYNKDQTDYAKLFNLMLRGNNNMIRFSGQGNTRKHNMSYGERNRLDLSRMLEHHSLCKDFNLFSNGFSLFLTRLDSYVDWTKTVVYIDSPYTNTNAVYNEQGGWTATEDQVLLNKVQWLREKGAKVIISNVFHNRGKTNQWLIDWCEEHKEHFEVHHLDRDYSNSASFKSNKKTDEVLIVSR